MKKIFILLIILSYITVLAEERFSPICLDNARSCRRAHAVGVYDKKVNKTFLCWAYANMDIGVIEYNHNTGRWSKRHILPGLGKKDFHNYPVMILDKSGHIHIFASSMGKKLHVHYVSQNTGSIEKWQTRKIKPLVDGNIGISYIMPMVLPETGEIFIFGRALFPGEEYSSSKRKFVMMSSKDNGWSWSPPQTVINFTNNQHDNNSPYPSNIIFAPQNNEYPDRFLFAWTTCNGHPADGKVKFNNVYFCYMSLSDALDHKKYKFYDANKRMLGSAVTEINRKQVLVFNTRNLPYRAIHNFFSISYLDNGDPCIVYRFKKKLNNGKTEINIWSALREKNKWSNKKINNNQYIFINNLLKSKTNYELTVLNMKGKNQFYKSDDNCKTWILKKEFFLYKSMKKWASITDYAKEIKYFSSVGGKSYNLTHSQPCYIYGDISPQLLCHYSFDNEINEFVGDTGLFQLNGKMRYAERAKGRIGKAFISSKAKPNVVVFPHCTEIINDFTISFWIKTASDYTPGKQMTIIGISTKNSSAESKAAGWKVGSFVPGKDILQFVIYDKQGRCQQADIHGFFKSSKNKWTKVTVVFMSGRFLKILINNKCETTRKTSIKNIAYAFGAFLTIGSDNFYGLIDDVRICDGIKFRPEKLKAYKYEK